MMKLPMIPTFIIASTLVSASVLYSAMLNSADLQSQKMESVVIVVVKTTQVVEATHDPIWEVQLVIDGTVKDKTEALIGRASRQNENRHIAGNKSPLPVGTYSIIQSEIASAPFPVFELGKGYWIPISPLFNTGRSSLGIHQDPSWGKTNGESGTSGCIGLKSKEDTAKVVNWIDTYHIHKLIVKS